MSEITEHLVSLLDKLVFNSGITSSTLITEDGLIIATNSAQNLEDELTHTDFAAISASILSMAERGIEIINKNKILEQIKIDAGLDKNNEADFTILVSRIYSNVLLQVIFPKKVNIGLIHFEINKIINEMKSIIKNDTKRELFSSIGSLT